MENGESGMHMLDYSFEKTPQKLTALAGLEASAGRALNRIKQLPAKASTSVSG